MLVRSKSTLVAIVWCALIVPMAALLFLVPSRAAAQAPAPKPVRLIVEAEDFKVAKGAWKVVPYRENYFASTFAISFLSRMACLGAPEQVEAGNEAVATRDVEIPYDGDFQVMARYEQPYLFSCEFTIEVLQGGKAVASQVFGRLQDPKIWALNGHKRVPMERYWWGGTDNIVWQNSPPVRLSRGPATIRLTAGPQLDAGKPRAMAAKRQIDVVCLTNDLAGIEAQKKTNYLEFDGWLVQDGDLFIRFTNPADSGAPCMPIVAPEFSGQHSPYYVHVRDWPTTRVLKSGILVSPTTYQIGGPRSHQVNAKLLAPVLDPTRFEPKAEPGKPKPAPTPIPQTEYLKPGESSGWVPVGQVLDSLHNVQWAPKAEYAGKVDGTYLKLEFAIPDGKGGLKPVREIVYRSKADGSGEGLFEIPGNVAANPTLRTQREALEWLLAEVKKFPKRGPAAKRFLLYSILGFSGALTSYPAARELALELGDNTAIDQKGKKRQLVAHWPDPTIPGIQKREATQPGGFSDLYIVSYGDEIHLPALATTDAEFAAWMKQRGIAYNGPITWINPKPSDPPAAAAALRKHPLYYYSQICAKEKGAQYFATGTAYYKSKGVLTGANYSPHANYLVTELDYIRPFKLRAMSMPWSEDYVWQIPEFSVQVMGYLTSGLRAGAKYDNLPVHMYVMPHSPGNTPRDFRLSFYTAVAHGARMINYFCATPLAVGYTENYVATDDLAMWRQIHACSHEAGTFEDYVVDGRVRQAKVGLLLSSVDDVLTGSLNSTFAMHNNERKAIYYALRHSQTPVDFLSEDDVIDGLAKDYQVIYVTQQWLHSKAVAALQKFAEAGGTVVALVGGGFLNEFNLPNAETGKLFGVSAQAITTDPLLVSKYLLEDNRPFLTKQDLPPYVPIDTVTWSLGEEGVKDVPVIVWRQKLVAADGKVRGTFKDGSPAVIEKTHGKGRAILFGFLPGQAYLKGALPLLPPDRGGSDAGYNHFLPTEMDAALRTRLVDDFLPAKFARPVQCSETLVESSVIDTPAAAGKPARLAVPLMNYTGKPIDKLVVKLPGVAAVKQIRSVERGPLKAEIKDGEATVVLPLEIADMLLIDR